ncbi:MAG: FG-GAP-like repeat-containing protein [Bacteroidetes bacterium]|nr:FG-GAP-like repeat-containing protein [Bacteroidota bacterium]
MKIPVNYSFRIILTVWTLYTMSNSGFSTIPETPRFIKVNSKTRSPISIIRMTSGKTGYFLAGNIYFLEQSGWNRLNLPLSQPVSLMAPVGTGDVWLTEDTPLNTSELYHFINGRLEKIPSPFANQILAMHFKDKDLGFFAGWNEIALFCKGVFKIIAPPPASREILKIYGLSENKFWALSQAGELFVYDHQVYKKILEGEKVLDFCFLKNGKGLILCKSGIFSTSGLQTSKIFSHNDLGPATRIEANNENEIWISGRNGLIRRFYHGSFQSIPGFSKENFQDIFLNGDKEVWISGDMGLLLYSGRMKIDQSPADNPGFSKYKLYEYGREANDEYGVAIDDFNGDGRKDIYSVCIFSADRLYIRYADSLVGMPPGNWFREEAIRRGASGISKSGNISHPAELHLGVAAADIDNDGDQDIYLCCLDGQNKLLLNDGYGYFRDVSSEKNRACEDLKRSNSAVFADVDNDGDLDLFVTSEKASNKLYLNDGTGHFRDVTASSGLSSKEGGMCASFADINNDGLPDLCVSFWFSTNKIYLNESRKGEVRFRDITAMTDLSKADPARSNAVVFNDINNDGSPDLFIINRNAPNKIYLNDGHGRFRDVSKQYFGDRTYLSNGAVVADFDLDGFSDLYITNVGNNVLYKNIGGKYFVDATSEFNAESYGYGTGCSAGDIDNDGDVDMYVANYIDGNSLLFLNTLEHKKSVKFVLSGTRSNRDAIGAKIILFRKDSAGHEQIAGYQEISGGGGYASISAKEAIFGMPPGYKYRAIIKFPSSKDTLRIPVIQAGDVFHISEETGFPAFKSQAFKATERMLKDPDNQLNIIKYLIILGIIINSLYRQAKRRTLRVRTLIIVYFLIFSLFIAINRVLQFESVGVSIFIPPLVVIICLLLLHLVTARIRLKRKADLEKQEVRENISRDLHDDLASTLGSISIYSETLIKGRQGDHVEAQGEEIESKIAELTHNALQSITDIIWMTSPRNDSVISLLSKIRNYYFDLFNDNHIRFSAEIETPEKDFEMKDPLRQNVFLILKETAANIIRHSGADLVTLRVLCSDGFCRITVEDNGNGFNPDDLPEDIRGGNGLINMRRRAIESGILLNIQSKVGSGSSVSLSFKMT